MGVAWSDFDGDGRPDLFVANDAGPNYLYKNNGNGTFVDVALQSGTALSEDGKAQGSMGVAIGDYDHSGGWSIFVTNFSDEYNALYKHEKAFQFTRCSRSRRKQRKQAIRSSAGERIFWTTTTTAGWTCWSSTGMSTRKWSGPGSLRRYAQRKLLYRNKQNGTFAEVTSTAGPALSEPSVSRGSAAGDLDNDGDLDVVVNNLDGAPTVLRNDGGNRRNFLVVDLEGRSGNRSAVGAVVIVTGNRSRPARGAARAATAICRTVTRGCTSDWARVTKVDAVEVRWPSGTIQRFREIPANTFIKFVEGAQAPQTIRREESRHR